MCENSTFLCKNGGQCENIESDGLIGFKCNCTSKYSGQLCEISIYNKKIHFL